MINVSFFGYSLNALLLYIWLILLISSTLFNFIVSTFPQSDDFLTSSYVDDFTIFCSNSNVDQMTEALSAHSLNIEEWADDRSLFLYATPI